MCLPFFHISGSITAEVHCLYYYYLKKMPRCWFSSTLRWYRLLVKCGLVAQAEHLCHLGLYFQDPPPGISCFLPGSCLCILQYLQMFWGSFLNCFLCTTEGALATGFRSQEECEAVAQWCHLTARLGCAGGTQRWRQCGKRVIPHVPPVCDISESSLVFEFDLPINVKLRPDTAFSQHLSLLCCR